MYLRFELLGRKRNRTACHFENVRPKTAVFFKNVIPVHCSHLLKPMHLNHHNTAIGEVDQPTEYSCYKQPPLYKPGRHGSEKNIQTG